MTLLNGLLALGAAAFTIPLVIHLLFRNRFQTLDWGAMRFLRNVVEQNRRRMQLLNWLLLLIRCLIPIFLAFCLARPIVTGWRQPRGDEPVALAVVLDNSYSMTARQEERRDRFAVAVETVRAIAGSLARGSEVVLLTSDGMSRVTDPAGIDSQLDQLRPGGGPFELDTLLGKAIGVLSQSAMANRQIVIVADHTASGFTQAMLDGLPAIRQRIASVTPTPEVVWVDLLGESPSPFRNLRIHSVESEANYAVPGQIVPWMIEAKVDGPAPEKVEFRMRVNSQPSERRTEIVRDGTARAMIPLTADQVGRQVVEVEVAAVSDPQRADWTDDFPPDNRFAVPLRVFEPVEVWLVDGHPTDKPLAGDTDYLTIALSPFATSSTAAGVSPADLFRPRKVRFGRLAETQAAGEWPAVVVLADVARPSAADSKWLVDFVQNQGGTLVVFGGPSIDSQWYDQNLIDDQQVPLLPLRFGEPRTSVAGLAIDETRLTYPPLSLFGTREKGTLAGTSFHGWLEMLSRGGTTDAPTDLPPNAPPNAQADGQADGATNSTAASADPATPAAASAVATSADAAAAEPAREANVVLRLEGGQPLMAIGASGLGRVLQIASTSNEIWTTLPLRPAFVPLMQRLLLHLSIDQDAGLVATAGEPLVLTGVGPDGEWSVSTPDNKSHRFKPETSLVWTDTSQAGAYRFESPSGEVIWSAVRVPDADLKPAIVDRETRELAAARLGATLHDSLDEYLAADASRRFGRGIWKYLLAALVIAMVLEPVVQQYRSRR